MRNCTEVQCLLNVDSIEDEDLGVFRKSLLQAQIVGVYGNVKVYVPGTAWNVEEELFRLEIPVLSWIIDHFPGLKALELTSCTIQPELLHLVGTRLP